MTKIQTMEGVSDNKINSDSSLPMVVVKTGSIDVIADDRSKTGTKRHPTEPSHKKKSDEDFEAIFQDILRRKMKDSWLNTTYQRAIWNARKRLTNGELLDDLPTAEKQIASTFMSPRMKPDYSKWLYPKKRFPHRFRLPQIPEGEGESPTKTPRPDLMRGYLPEHFVRSFHGDLDTSSIEGMQVYPLEFISLSDRLTLHEPPWLTSLRHGTESSSYDQFGLCYGCFHKKKPHYHYHAPIRTGGGFTIYRRHPFNSGEMTPNYVKMDTVRWITQGERQNDRIECDNDIGEATITDDFTTNLFHIFLSNGGDPNALKEYLESNFDPDVLDELESLGVKVQLIKDYAEFLRRHVRDKLNETLEKQGDIVKGNDFELQLVKRFIEVTSAGGDLHMLLMLLKHGLRYKEIVEYEKRGGNIELHQHYASRLLFDYAGIQEEDMEDVDALTQEQKEKKDDLIERLQAYIENELDHKNAMLLLEYMSKGGRLDVLVEYVDKGPDGEGIKRFAIGKGDLSLVREYAEKLNNDKTKLLQDIERFIKDHFRSYSSANLLQKYIENGGEVRVLKQYVRDGCSFSSEPVQRYVKVGGNTRLLQNIGQEFVSDEAMREDLEQFPDDPKVLEAYIRRGGNFPRLVKEIAGVMGEPLIEDYVKRQTDKALSEFKKMKGQMKSQKSEKLYSKSASGMLQTRVSPPPNSPTQEKQDESHIRSISSGDMRVKSQSPNEMTKNILPQVIESARAELVYDKLMATDEIMKQNEGAFLARTVDFNQEMLPVTSVSMTPARRHPAYSFYQSSDSKDSATVSLLTGDKRPRLWKPPPPFTIRKSEAAPTKPRSPFSQDRSYDISALTEDHILGIEKRQRHELDVLRRNYNSKDFRESWRVAVTSPEGSVFSELDSTITGEFEETKPAFIKQPESQDTKTKEKKDKVSRRERQRAKMKALKSKSSEKARDSPYRDDASRVSSASSSVLTVPQDRKLESLVSMPPESKPTTDLEVSLTEHKDTKKRTRSRSSVLSTKRESVQRNSTDASVNSAAESRNFALDISSMKTTSDSGVGSDQIEKENVIESSSEDEIKNANEPKVKHEVPPLPLLDDDDNDSQESPYQTAFGKSTPRTSRTKKPIFPDMIENPQTQVSEDDKEKVKPTLSPRLRQRRPTRPRPPVQARASMKDLAQEGEQEDNGSAVDDVLRKYCIIREERLPRYRLIFDKHLILREMRLRERAMKAQRANSILREEDFQPSLDDEYGPEHEELKKYEFLETVLVGKIDDLENEISVAKGCLDRSKALTARELLAKNGRLLKTPRGKKSRSKNRTLPTGDVENFRMEDAETAMGSIKKTKNYDYDQSARVGFGNSAASTPRPLATPNTGTPRSRGTTPRPDAIPLEEFSDAQVLNKLDTKTRKKIAEDPVVKHNKAAISMLEDELKRMRKRLSTLQEHLEKQRVAAEREKEFVALEKQRRDKFVRQQSELYQALHPIDDPVLSIDDVPEALRDVNGEISRADSGIILEALEFPRQGDGVNFRLFCILAALSESALSIQPLVRRLARKRDARALNVKMDKCKEIYRVLLGPNVESLQSELRSSGFSSAQYQQVIRKLTRDDGSLSFLDFVTYVPLFLDIHQRIISDPLAG